MIDPEFYAENPDLIAVMQAKLIQIQGLQPRRVAWFRDNGVVFQRAPFTSSPASDEERWEQIAFACYTDLCEAESLAREALST
jgi:hypothetical protein